MLDNKRVCQIFDKFAVGYYLIAKTQFNVSFNYATLPRRSYRGSSSMTQCEPLCCSSQKRKTYKNIIIR